MIFDFEKKTAGFVNSPFLEDLWFKDEIDDIFSSDNAGEGTNGNLEILYDINTEYKTQPLAVFYPIKKEYQNSQTSLFYKIGFNAKTPPIRIILKDFDDD